MPDRVENRVYAAYPSDNSRDGFNAELPTDKHFGSLFQNAISTKPKGFPNGFT